MTNRETVITHLQIIHTWAEFARERDLQFFTPKHLENIAEWTDDTIALLKGQPQQEIVDPVKPIDVDDSFTWLCNYCKGELFCGDRIRDNYCPTCGRKIKWNGFC